MRARHKPRTLAPLECSLPLVSQQAGITVEAAEWDWDCGVDGVFGSVVVENASFVMLRIL